MRRQRSEVSESTGDHSSAPPWWVLTGGPSVGKTTLLERLARLGYATVPEAAAQVIDEGISAGETLDSLRSDEGYFQLAIARRKQLLEASASRDRVTILDRGMHETVAYLRHFRIDVPAEVHALIEGSSYRRVFLLEPLETFQASKHRAANKEDLPFTAAFTETLAEVYAEYGLDPIRLPAITVEERLALVVQDIERAGT